MFSSTHRSSGARAVTLSTSYAFGNVFNVKHSLHRSWRDARVFYAIYAGLVLAAAGIVILPGAPLGLITTAVQVLAGILLPSATIFLLLLCNDRDVLGPWVNGIWTNILASIIVGMLVMLSLILAATTLFPTANIQLVTLALAAVLVAGLLAMGAGQLRHHSSTARSDTATVARSTWRMPPLSTLPKPVWSAARTAGMLALRAYLVVAAVLMAVKIVQLALGH